MFILCIYVDGVSGWRIAEETRRDTVHTYSATVSPWCRGFKMRRGKRFLTITSQTRILAYTKQENKAVNRYGGISSQCKMGKHICVITRRYRDRGSKMLLTFQTIRLRNLFFNRMPAGFVMRKEYVQPAAVVGLRSEVVCCY